MCGPGYTASGSSGWPWLDWHVSITESTAKQDRETMTLYKRTYDAIWYVTAAISLCAVLVADGGNQWPKWLLPVLLGPAIAISAYLSLFVTRSTAQCASDTSAQPSEPVPDLRLIAVQQEAEAAQRTRQLDTILYIPNTFDDVLEVRSVDLRVHMRAEMSDYLRQSEYVSVINFARSLRQAASEQQVVRRRNIASEACEIARELRGTGAEVLISPDDYILIRQGQQDTEKFTRVAFTENQKIELPN
jgi:hypothetical protein